MSERLPIWPGKPTITLYDTPGDLSRPAMPTSAVPHACSKHSSSADIDSITTTTTTRLTTTTTTTSAAPTAVTATTTTASVALNASPSIMAFPNDRTAWVNALLNQQMTGVPPLHQCIISHDFGMATALLAAGAELASRVVPPLTEKTQDGTGKRPAFALVHSVEKFHADAPGAVTSKIYSIHKNYLAPPSAKPVMNETIVDFVLHLKSRAPGENLHLVGANALTLSSLCGAPPEFLEALYAAVNATHAGLINACDNQGRTALGIAAATGNEATVTLLLKHGADVDARDGQGMAPVDHAIANGHFALVCALVDHGAGSPIDTRWRLKQEVSQNQPKGSNPVLTRLFACRHIDSLLAYQSQSKAHRVAVFKSLLGHCKHIADHGSASELKSFLAFASPLLSARRIAKIAIAMARRPGKLEALMVALNCVPDTTFPVKMLPALRDAAGKSGDDAMLELAVSLDPQLTKLLTAKSKPDAGQQSSLNRLLALALQAHSSMLATQAKKRGAVLDLADPALAGLPMVAIVADSGDHALLETLIKGYLHKANKRLKQVVIDAIDAIRTGTGLLTLESTFPKALEAADRYQMLCHAVLLGDEAAVQALVQRGADINFLANRNFAGTSTFGDSIYAGEPTPIRLAIDTGNLSMINTLAGLGAIVRLDDLRRAEHQSADIQRALEQLAEAAND